MKMICLIYHVYNCQQNSMFKANFVVESIKKIELYILVWIHGPCFYWIVAH